MANVAIEQTATRTQRKFALAGLPNWWYLLPTIFFFLGWQLWPIFRVAWMSLTDYRFITAPGTAVHFIGLDNYRQAIHDPLMWRGLLRAFGFTALFVPGMIIFPMVVAVMIDRIRNNKVATFYRLVLLIPSMIPGPLIFVLWKWMYDLYIGPINWFLVDVTHIFSLTNEPQWLGSTRLVFLAIAMMEWWWGLGYHTMFFLAGLATIPRDITDAARVDGANEWRLFWNITVPRLLPIILVLVVLRFGTAMAVIDEYLIMGGGFDRTRPTYTWTIYMWQEAFRTSEQVRSYAATIGWIGAIAMLFVVGGMFYVFRSRD